MTALKNFPGFVHATLYTVRRTNSSIAGVTTLTVLHVAMLQRSLQIKGSVKLTL